jgi:hypothetical protein
MSTKTQIQTLINTIIDGGLNTAQKVRDVLNTGANSVLNNIYGTEYASVIESIPLGFPLTFTNETYGYVSLIKQGRKVTIKGNFNMPFDGSFVMNINVADFPELVPFTNEFVGNGVSNVDGSGVSFVTEGNTIKNQNALVYGETINFVFNYNTLN